MYDTKIATAKYVIVLNLATLKNVCISEGALTHGNTSTLSEKKFFPQYESNFESSHVTKPLVIESPSRYQMKDIDITILLMPFDLQ